MIQIPIRKSASLKYNGLSIWSPEYQKLLIDNDSAKHTWSLILNQNSAKIIALNNHKFDLHFDRDFEHVSCTCTKFIEDELNWCQHLSALKYYADYNHKNFRALKHSRKPNIIFYDSQEKDFFIPFKNKFIEFEEIAKSKALVAPSIGNIIIPKNEKGFIPAVINPLTGITLYSYQNKAIKHMLYHKRTILSLEMGWGKTLCAIICSKHILDQKPDAKILIACPKSLKSQWEKEINKHLTASVQNVKTNKEVLKNSTFTIVNYEMARNYTLNSHYDIIVLDEVQKIKNKNTKAWKAISKIDSEWCWALSGTVIENNVEDFLSVADILQPELFKVRWKFYDHFCEVDNKFIKGFKNSAELNKILDTIIYRAPDNESPLTLKMDQKIIKVSMTQKQKSLHDNYYREVRKLLAISSQRPLSFSEKMRLSAMQTRARQAADSALLIDKTLKEKSSKITTILKLIKENPGKIVLFSEWKEFLSLVENELTKQKIKFVRFDGGLSQKQRKLCIDQFINDPNITVFSTTDAGGIGVDGLQHVSNVMIHGGMTWNPSRVAQREGRLYRIGQSKDIKTYMLISTDSIEESIINTHKRKTQLKNVIFGN